MSPKQDFPISAGRGGTTKKIALFQPINGFNIFPSNQNNILSPFYFSSFTSSRGKNFVKQFFFLIRVEN